jgi:hypothetical protein
VHDYFSMVPMVGVRLVSDAIRIGGEFTLSTQTGLSRASAIGRASKAERGPQYSRRH